MHFQQSTFLTDSIEQMTWFFNHIKKLVFEKEKNVAQLSTKCFKGLLYDSYIF